MEELKKIIYRIRKNHHLTQKDFAKLVGVTERTVQRWESGSTAIKYSRLVWFLDQDKKYLTRRRVS
jgi:transcriptional regulator with XRE-family HTH domain